MIKDNYFKKILIINPFGIGDLLFSTPLIKNLKDYYPHSQITVLTARRSAPVLKNNPHVNSVIGFNRGDFKELKKESRIKAYKEGLAVLGKIIAFRFNLYIDLSLENRYSLFVALLGIKPRLGYNYKKRGRFLTKKLDMGGFVGRHVVEYHLSLLRFLGGKPKFYNSELFISEGEKNWADDFLKKAGLEEGQKLVAIAPGGGKAWGDKAWYKYWPLEKFAGLVNKLQDEGIKVILVGDDSDIAICDNLIQLLKDEPINFCGKTNLRQLFALLSKSDLIICNDSGTLHAATALDKKIVVLFGPTHQESYGPYPPSAKRIVISKDFSCRPCYNRFGVDECKYNHQCLEQIEVEEVREKVESLLCR